MVVETVTIIFLFACLYIRFVIYGLVSVGGISFFDYELSRYSPLHFILQIRFNKVTTQLLIVFFHSIWFFGNENIFIFKNIFEAFLIFVVLTIRSILKLRQVHIVSSELHWPLIGANHWPVFFATSSTQTHLLGSFFQSREKCLNSSSLIRSSCIRLKSSF